MVPQARFTLPTFGLALASLFVSPSLASASSAEPAFDLGVQTDAKVQDSRLVTVPGSTVKLALWNERSSDGQLTPHYAISLDGGAFVASTATDYTLMLRRATFDPLVAAPSFDKSLLPAGDNIYIVQFVTQPLEEFRQALVQLGGTIYDYVGNHAYLVKLPGMARAEAGELSFVRWIGNFHGEYRLDGLILDGLNQGTLPPSARYNVMVFERGPTQKDLVAARIVGMGGSIDNMFPEGFRFEATLNAEMIRALAGMDEVSFIDPWGEPGTDMDIARQISGATYLEPLGSPAFDGTGVRGEVMDGGVQFSHPEFAATPIIAHGTVSNDSHGTSTCGQIFANGNNVQAKGLLHNGQPIMSDYGTVTDRYLLTSELVNPSLVYKGVFQSNSWGDPQTTQYTSKSFELDDIIFINDVIICQSMSNTNSQNARPQAWAKNIVSVGGIDHANTLSKTDDNVSSATFGPAADGRIKPEFSHFYDNIFTTTTTSTYTTGFGGTSGATPITAGHFGLFFQMWSQQVFNNPVPNPGGTVFENRCHAMTAKAFMVNNASPYDWTAGGAGAGLTRVKQGWGLVDIRNTYDRRLKTFYIDQSQLLSNLQTVAYPLTVTAGTPELRATLCYLDPAGTVSAAQHRKNDLTLKVTSPSSTIFFGNNGLSSGLFSTSGGVANTKDTVENVFIQNPAAGTWTVEVLGSDINTDAALSDPGVNARFALVVTGVEPGPSCAAATVYCTGKANALHGAPACPNGVLSISGTGTPSATATSGFLIAAVNARNNKIGILIYKDSVGGSAMGAQPFAGGTLCLATGLGPNRTTSVNSGGTLPPVDDCTGVYGIDMNTFARGLIAGPPLPQAYLSIVGQEVVAQFWGRDPGFPPPNNVQLSDGLRFTICP